jgi:hypothetical protein
MHMERCPLCYMRTKYGAIEHLEQDHRRTYAQACILVESGKEGTLGWNAHDGKAPACPSLVTSRPLWLSIPWPIGDLGFL